MNGWFGVYNHDGVRHHDGLSAEEKNTSDTFELHLELADSILEQFYIPSFFP